MISPAGWPAVAQRWDENEPGWGLRSNGWSLHVDAEQHRGYVSAVASAPFGSESDRPDGEPFTVVVDERVRQRLKDSQHGLRIFDRRSTPIRGQVLREMPEAQDAAAYIDRLRSMHGDR